jgi:type IV pilus assembly protein PilC
VELQLWKRLSKPPKAIKIMYLTANEKLTIVSELATMLSSGIPISESIASLQEGSKGNVKKLLDTLAEDVSEGKTISYSFEKIHGVFDPVTISLLRAGEKSGNLETTLKDIKNNIAKDIEFNNKVSGALAYPATIFVVFGAVIILILTFVIPRIAGVFSKLRVVLPLPTRILISVSNFVLAYYPYIILTVIALIVLTALLFRYKKRELLNILFSLPFISKIIIQIDLARFTRNFSILLKSGIPIIEALELTKKVVNKKEIAKMISFSIDEITKGGTLSSSLIKYSKVLPSTMIKIVQGGEKSGKLETSLSELSEYFDLRVTNSLKTATTLIEPILLIIIGLMVGGMMLAIISPIYGLIGQINAR